jgi:hypothetical protein
MAVAAAMPCRLEFSPDSQDLWAVSSITPSTQDDSSTDGTGCSVMRFCATSGRLLQVGWLPDPCLRCLLAMCAELKAAPSE